MIDSIKLSQWTCHSFAAKTESCAAIYEDTPLLLYSPAAPDRQKEQNYWPPLSNLSLLLPRLQKTFQSFGSHLWS